MNRCTCSRWLLTSVIGLLPFQLAMSDQPQLSVSFHDEGATVFEGKSPVLSYQAKSRSHEGGWQRADYVHPIYGLDGKVITEDFPDDHRHHRGVFWAWHQVWVGDKRLGDPWVCQDFQWDVQSVAANTPGDHSVSITAVTHWKSPAFVDATDKPIAVVREQAEMRVHAKQAHYRVIDFRLSLLALRDDVRIGGSEDEKGYGGFSPRIRMNGDERFLSESGSLEPTTMAITAGTWVNITRENSGTAILCHRDNPQVTKQHAMWILRRNRSMQNAVFPGREPVTISTTQPLHLRYRLVVHDGTLTSEDIRAQQSDFWSS